MKNKYHGWIIIDERNGYISRYFAEYLEGEERKRQFFDSPQAAVEWWDERLGKTVSLMPTIKGCYRVYLSEFEREG